MRWLYCTLSVFAITLVILLSSANWFGSRYVPRTGATSGLLSGWPTEIVERDMLAKRATPTVTDSEHVAVAPSLGVLSLIYLFAAVVLIASLAFYLARPRWRVAAGLAIAALVLITVAVPFGATYTLAYVLIGVAALLLLTALLTRWRLGRDAPSAPA